MDQIADRITSPSARRDAPTSTGTIFALASGTGRAAVAVMRVSGPDASKILASLCRLPPPRRASLRRLCAPDGEMLDRALVLWLPAPASYTGEDCAELFLHGGHAVIDAVSMALAALGARPAEPGEFTRRAFLNGRMDLLEAEAIADLVEAETSTQRRQALRQLEGELGALYRGWTDRLRRLLANAEALIDFSDQDLPEIADDTALEELRAAIAAHLADDRRGERLREGFTIVVAGPPNAGKSSLINVLSGREIAIVSPVPGTTRDALETRMVLGGLPVTLIDTAGLRESADPVEAEGIRRAHARAAAADLVLAVTDSTDPIPFVLDIAAPVLAVANKTDLAPPPGPEYLPVSALTGTGLSALRDRLTDFVETLARASGPPPLTRARHRAALGEAEAALAAALTAPAAELRAEELRLALAAIGRITGSICAEDILDTIVSSFCIGK